MAKFSGEPICKRCRREGQKLMLKGERCGSSKCAFTRRSYRPGAHGILQSRPSDFAKRLREKQKLKAIYGIGERQLKNYYKKATAVGSRFTIIQLLELRLDNVVYRLGLATTRRQARQIVSHGKVLVAGRKTDIPSHQVKIGDEIKIVPSFSGSPAMVKIMSQIKKAILPSWLKIDIKTLTGNVLDIPKPEEIDTPIEENLIIEYYSR